MLMLIGMATNIAMKPLTTPILLRVPYRRLLLVNGIVLALGFAGFAMIGHGSARAALIALLIGTGLGRSLQFTGLTTLAFMDFETERMRAATTLFSTAMQMNGAMGIALAAAAIDISARIGGRQGAPDVADFQVGFVAIAFVCLLGALDALRLDPTRRAEQAERC